MSVTLKHRGREVTDEDARFIQELIRAHPGKSRLALSKLLCEAWNWRQPNGELRDMVCRSLMLALHRAGLIELPPVRFQVTNNAIRHHERKHQSALIDRTDLDLPLSALRPLELRQVRRTSDERMCDALIAEHHYLGYTRPVGEHLKYLVYALGRPLACITWSSAPRHLGPRDRFIGWSAVARRQNIRFLAYNTRFLILPWVRVPHLASHILARVAKQLPADWARVYGHAIYYLETFVEPDRFRGTCYRAANWIALGLTTGRGKADQTKLPNRPLKEVMGYPLTKKFRELLADLEVA
ncbi:MAG: DUF4338 domain-containing protein [Vicinamibacteria bacterium]